MEDVKEMQTGDDLFLKKLFSYFIHLYFPKKFKQHYYNYFRQYFIRH